MTTQRRSVSVRRRTVWANTHVSVSIPNAGESLFSLHAQVLSENFDLTVVRTLISLDILEGVTAAVVGIQAVYMGIGIASQESFNASVVPNPQIITESPARGWLWKAMRLVQGTQTLNSYRIVHIEYDIAAQRKLDKGEMYMVIENNAFDGVAGAVRVHGEIRTLFKR